MPDEVGASTFHRILNSCTRGRLAVGVACVAVTTIGAFAASSARGAAGVANTNSTAAQASADGDDASVLGSLGLTPRFDAGDGETLAAIERYVQIASQPTSTPVLPTVTPVPPTATPPPQPSPTRPAPVQAPPNVAPPTVAPTPPPPPPAPAAPAQTQPSGLDTSPMDGYAQALFDDTNRRRVANGLPPLRANGYLIGIARIRSQDMADHNYFAHVSPVTGDNAFTLMDKHGVPYGWAGENLAKNNYPIAETVGVADLALWNSPPHRENILNPHYTDMGVALAVDPTGMKYFTIIFTGPA